MQLVQIHLSYDSWNLSVLSITEFYIVNEIVSKNTRDVIDFRIGVNYLIEVETLIYLCIDSINQNK